MGHGPARFITFRDDAPRLRPAHKFLDAGPRPRQARQMLNILGPARLITSPDLLPLAEKPLHIGVRTGFDYLNGTWVSSFVFLLVVAAYIDDSETNARLI